MDNVTRDSSLYSELALAAPDKGADNGATGIQTRIAKLKKGGDSLRLTTS